MKMPIAIQCHDNYEQINKMINFFIMKALIKNQIYIIE